MEALGPRSIFHEKVGHRSDGRKTFHWDLFIADSNVTQVVSGTNGTRYDWGSGPSGGWEKSGVTPTSWVFSYKKAEERSNTWDFVGATDWPESKIMELLTDLGTRYHFLTNNCRVWTKLAALALVLPTDTTSVEDAKACVSCFDELSDIHSTMLRWEDLRVQPGNDDFKIGLSQEKVDRYMQIIERLPVGGYYDTSDRVNAKARLTRAMEPGFTTAGVSSWDEAFGSRLGTIDSFRNS